MVTIINRNKRNEDDWKQLKCSELKSTVEKGD